MRAADSAPPHPHPPPRLTAIGLGIGLAFGYATGWLLRWLRWRGVPAYVEAGLTVTLAYLAFYVTQVRWEGGGVRGHTVV